MRVPSPLRREPPFAEFVGLIALMMALTALSIDIILVALPDIGDSFAVREANHRQFVVTAYLIGFACGQPLYGPLSDRFGRKPVLYVGLLLFAAGSAAAMAAPEFSLVLASRALQGFGAAAPRVIAVAIVRDRFAGRGMSRVMSFVMMVFIIVPILAPTVGGGILFVAAWRWIFLFLLLVAVATFVWSAFRLPETRTAADRSPLSAIVLTSAVRRVTTNRQTVGYTIAAGFVLGTLMGYINSAEQVFVETYGLGKLFPLVFGTVAAVMIPASLTNARLVERLGMRRLSHLALVGYLLASVVVAVLGFPERPPLIPFCLMLAVLFFCFGLMMPNFNALAMEPMGRIAGTASSFIGFYTTAAGAVFGGLVGQAFDGTVRPMMIGFGGLGLLALISVLATERGRLFHSGPPDGDRLVAPAGGPDKSGQ